MPKKSCDISGQKIIQKILISMCLANLIKISATFHTTKKKLISKLNLKKIENFLLQSRML